MPNPDNLFLVETDEGIQAIGEVLIQREGELEYRRLFYSQPLNAAQRTYSTYERELLAVLKAWHAFRVYLLGRDSTLSTDHSALSKIFTSPLSSITRVAMWLLAIQPFRFIGNHSKSKEYVAAHKLSRFPWPVAFPKTVENVKLAGEIEVDTDSEEESDSDSEA